MLCLKTRTVIVMWLVIGAIGLVNAIQKYEKGDVIKGLREMTLNPAFGPDVLIGVAGGPLTLLLSLNPRLTRK